MIRSCTGLFEIINYTKFDYTYDYNNQPIVAKFKSKQLPYYLSLTLNYSTDTAILSFGSKVLYDDYYKLISKDTIYQCFESILSEGFVWFDPEEVIKSSIVLQCDFTTDVKQRLDKDLWFCLSHLRDTEKYLFKSYKDESLLFIRDVKSKKIKTSLTIYDKFKEINKKKNAGFISALRDKGALISRFKDTIRVELKIRSLYKLKELTGLWETGLHAVLEITENPVLKVFNHIYDEKHISKMAAVNNYFFESIPKTRKELETDLIINFCDGDLGRIKQLLKPLYNEKTNFRKVMIPFKQRLMEKGLVQEGVEPKGFKPFCEMRNKLVA